MSGRRRLVVTIVAVLIVVVLIGAAIAGAMSSTQKVEEPQPSPTVTMITDPVQQQEVAGRIYQPSDAINAAIDSGDYDKAIALLNADLANYAPDDSKSENIHQLINVLELEKENGTVPQPNPTESLDPSKLPQ